VNTSIYAESVTRDTYEELRHLANLILKAGYLTVIDAAFLLRWQRDILRQLAKERNVPFVIVSCLAKDEELRRRLMQREQAGRDSSEATLEVLMFQLETQEPLDADERDFAVVFNTERELAGVLQQKVSDALQLKWKC